ncbi:MAG: histidine phosphatase family protein [Anaerolineae bacterium]|nr:histidine phosphatase family protein [Anaerolineae bacterium]
MNAEKRVQGWLDSPLDDVGRAQAQAAAERMRREEPAALYSSPLQRARETAEIIAAALALEPVVDGRLKERGLGHIAGLSGEEIDRSFPGLREKWQAWKMVAAPGGEQPAVFWQRVAEVFDQIVDRHPEDVVAVVTHGGVLAAYFGHLLEIETGRWAPFSFSNGSLSIVDVADGGARIWLVNDRCHLDDGE